MIIDNLTIAGFVIAFLAAAFMVASVEGAGLNR